MVGWGEVGEVVGVWGSVVVVSQFGVPWEAGAVTKGSADFDNMVPAHLRPCAGEGREVDLEVRWGLV